MASITILIDDAIVQRVTDAFALQHQWSADMGISKGQFLKQQVIAYIKASVKAAEGRNAANIARITAETSVENEIVLT